MRMRAGQRPGGPPAAERDEVRLRAYFDRVRVAVRAPQGFPERVMAAVYRDSLAPREPAVPRTSPVARWYRRLALCFMLTAAVLAVSLLLPGGAYSTLIASQRTGAALGGGPAAAVRTALAGAARTVQGALGEGWIEGEQR